MGQTPGEIRMGEGKEKSSEVVAEIVRIISHDLGVVLRHILPGTLILGAVYIRRPGWFDGLTAQPTTQQFVVLGVVSLALGNLGYAFNRYVCLHGIEYLVFCCGCLKWLLRFLLARYMERVGKEITRFYGDDQQEIRDLIKWRDSASVYLLIGAESLFFAAWNPGHPFDTLPWGWYVTGLVISALMLLGGLCLYAMNRLLVSILFPAS